MDVFLYLRSDMKYILVSHTIMSVYLLIFMLCDVLKDSGRSFYLMSDEQHSLVTDTNMAIFLLLLY